MLFGTGLTPDDLNKAQVGIASVWYEGNTCNMHLNKLADEVKKGVTAAGLVGMRFNTIGVSDGISMGPEGMCYALPSRDLIADPIETLGMSLPCSSAIPAEDPLKAGECIAAGKAILNLLEKDLKPRDIMTRPAFENAMTLVMALGGSTNAVLHLVAMARSVNVPLTLDDLQKTSDRVT